MRRIAGAAVIGREDLAARESYLCQAVTLCAVVCEARSPDRSSDCKRVVTLGFGQHIPVLVIGIQIRPVCGKVVFPCQLSEVVVGIAVL